MSNEKIKTDLRVISGIHITIDIMGGSWCFKLYDLNTKRKSEIRTNIGYYGSYNKALKRAIWHARDYISKYR